MTFIAKTHLLPVLDHRLHHGRPSPSKRPVPSFPQTTIAHSPAVGMLFLSKVFKVIIISFHSLNGPLFEIPDLSSPGTFERDSRNRHWIRPPHADAQKSFPFHRPGMPLFQDLRLPDLWALLRRLVRVKCPGTFQRECTAGSLTEEEKFIRGKRAHTRTFQLQHRPGMGMQCLPNPQIRIRLVEVIFHFVVLFFYRRIELHELERVVNAPVLNLDA